MGSNTNDPNASSSVVVWEFQDDSNQWIPYSAEVCCQIERAHNKSLSLFYLGDVDPKLAPYCINFYTSHQLRRDIGTKRPIRRSCYGDFSCPGQGIAWCWLGDQSLNDWCSYSISIQQEIENAYKTLTTINGPGQINLEQFSLQLPYIVDFLTMSQMAKLTKNRRAVRRVAGRPYPSSSSGSDAASFQPHSQPYNLRQTTYGPTVNSSVAVNGVNNVQPSTSSFNGASLGSKVRSWLVRQMSNPALATPSTTQILPSKSKVVRAKSTGSTKSSSIRIRDVYAKPTIVDNTSPTLCLSANEILKNCTKVVQHPEDEDCSICCEKLSNVSAYAEDSTVVSLLKCGHTFHKACVEELRKNGISNSCLQCPTCKTIHGVKIGNQPNGTMQYNVIKQSLAGFEDCGTILIVYSFQGGIQGPEHPSPGSRYTSTGFPRACYLPDNEKGRKVLRLLCIAWQRRLIFTIGSSVTTGRDNTVTWNEIHHKTEFPSNYSGHGYPDANYLDNVLLELATHGVTEEDDV